MSDIPDWLIELAAQRDEDEEDEEPEWDFLRSEPDSEDEQEAPGTRPFAESTEAEAPVSIEELDSSDEGEQDEDVMEALRSQVEAEEEADVLEPSDASGDAMSLRIAGLKPWQQLVLAILILMDVVVIGMLLLVMLGRVSIP